ncbi:von Willebrand factor type A domain-containing protein [Chitinophaga niastensis]|uniref:von Willebrand factor type A domain-containing protein n=1 Tax=Chitinophaga niastensis TaxID=536980 RepID=A0A2P8HH03_CHINA|nr:VWA domain-containing protein [Chitinophaga niastensis]PSL45489.1 von Willebrand factor type A domain-containing protein [Chitinophaga niastensis]
MQEYLFQASAVTAQMPLKAGQKAARKGMAARLPEAAKMITSGAGGHTLTRNLVATVKHYLVHNTFELKYTSTQHRSQLRLLLIVDTSASMAADQQISLVKGLIADMMQRYQHRQPQISVIALSHGRADIIVPPTNDAALVTDILAQLYTGGKTNLTAGFEQVLQTIDRQQGLHDHQLYLFTDGRINAGNTPQPFEEAITFFHTHLKQLAKQTSIINTETGYPRLGMAVTLAERLGCHVFEPEY